LCVYFFIKQLLPVPPEAPWDDSDFFRKPAETLEFEIVSGVYLSRLKEAISENFRFKFILLYAEKVQLWSVFEELFL
jgi:hypothetical protein